MPLVRVGAKPRRRKQWSWPLVPPDRDLKPPIDPASLDRLLVEAVEASRKGDEDKARRVLVIHQNLQLRYDRWRVRSGPTPFLDFTRLVRPDLMIGLHHRLLDKKFTAVAEGKTKRLILSMPPGHSKSLYSSVLLPAWLFGLCPSGRILSVTHSENLTHEFGNLIREIIDSDAFRRLFPDVLLAARKANPTNWSTTNLGQYKGAGTSSNIAGKRADLIGNIDDPISEQDAYSDASRTRVNDWYPQGFRSRVMPGTPIIITQTRWHSDDLTGRQIKIAKANPKADQWEVMTIPAELDQQAVKLLNSVWTPKLGIPKARLGGAPFPQLWPTSEMQQIKATVPPATWNALYMQSPTDGLGGIIPRSAWRAWPSERPRPTIEHLAMFWDTAFEDDETADFNACTVWGVFFNEKINRHEVMLLGRFHKRLTFPELRRQAFAYYKAYNKSSIGPVDSVYIEPKASGKSLVQEIRRAGVPVLEFQHGRDSRGRERSKVARAHAASVIPMSGSVWYLEDALWAEEVIDECAAFPNGEHDDLVDTCIMAWTYLRRTWWMMTEDDADQDPRRSMSRVRGEARTDDDIHDDDGFDDDLLPIPTFGAERHLHQ